MFKHSVFIIISLIFTFALNSQEVERLHRVGVSGAYRMDNEQMWGAELSCQVYLEGIRCLEINFGWLDAATWDIFQWTAIYHWILIRKGGFGFYTGPGTGIGYANYNYGKDLFYGVIAVNAGVDYTFNIPLSP